MSILNQRIFKHVHTADYINWVSSYSYLQSSAKGEIRVSAEVARTAKAATISLQLNYVLLYLTLFKTVQIYTRLLQTLLSKGRCCPLPPLQLTEAAVIQHLDCALDPVPQEVQRQ